MIPMELPADLRLNALQLPGGSRWLQQFNNLCAAVLESWQLEADPAGGGPWFGQLAAVVPVRTPSGTPAVLKLAVPHDEALLESAALRIWDGRGAVALLRTGEDPFVQLLERLDGDRSLLDVPLDGTAAVWGPLVRQLHRSPEAAEEWPPFETVAATAEQWSDSLPADWSALGEPFDRWLLECALEVCQVRGTVGRREARDVLVHTDLHYGNVLARMHPAGSFAAIGPKPMLGEAEFEVAPMLWNRIPDLHATDPETHLVRRCEELCAAAELQTETARQWSIVREVANALDYLQRGNSGHAQRSLWVASTLAGRTLPGLPPAHELPLP